MIHDFRLGRVCYRIATLGPIGFLPAPGTVATLITACALFLGDFAGLPAGWLKLIFMPLTAIGSIITHYALLYIQQHDPSEIVIDEVLGFSLVMIIFPRTLGWLSAAFVLFRLFDIFKPLGIRRLEQLEGASGVLLDDLLAGVYTQLVLILACMGYDLWFR